MLDSPREELKQLLENRKSELVDILLTLLASPSENPPADTERVAEAALAILREGHAIDVSVDTVLPPITNVVAVLRGKSAGRRIVFNGHLDTFEIGDEDSWTTKPTGEVKANKVYGRGAGDMKGGVAAQIFAALCLAEFCDHFDGELVLALTGDEQSGGEHGTAYLLDHNSDVHGDAMICGDAGSPNVIRFGEKGTLWMTVRAEGKAGHGAHTHLTENAIDRLLPALSALKSLEDVVVDIPLSVLQAIEDAAAVSGKINGVGETHVLNSITVNVGTIEGGTRCNLAANDAVASLDIRFPPGISLEEMQKRIAALITDLPGISFEIDYTLDVNMTDPEAEIVKTVVACAKEVSDATAVANMRVGSSDAALFRLKGIPSVICGLTAHNMGDVDEYIEVRELEELAKIYALSAFDFLSKVQENSN